MILGVFRFFQGFEINPLVCGILMAGAAWSGMRVLKVAFGPVAWPGQVGRVLLVMFWLTASVGLWNWGRWNFATDRAYPMFGLACAFLSMAFIFAGGGAIAFSVLMVLIGDPVLWLLHARKKAAK